MKSWTLNNVEEFSVLLLCDNATLRDAML